MDYLFTACLVVWAAFSLLRFVQMYDPTSPLQRWRQWDWFHLVPVGAFFSPTVPQTEPSIVVRDFLPDGRVTPWTEVPRIRSRIWWHTLWNPQKQMYRAKLESARSLLSAAGQLSADGYHLPAAFLLSEPYLTLLRYATDLPRLSKPRATQFAVIETDLLTRRVIRTVLSSVHEV
jgi:hypothetical protein